jgi:hypothetical protein
MSPSKKARRAEGIPTAPWETDQRVVRRARTFRQALLVVLAAFVLLGASTLLGARTATVSASGGDYDLTVVYPATTRPGLAIRWIALVHRAGGFDHPIQIATTTTYFNLFDFNNLDPTPTELTTSDGLSMWMFDPPPGDTFRITMDARLEPARQHGSQATTSLSVGGVTLVAVHYRTRVMP